ncbi:MAG: excinuclease ABC subunit UvrC [Planctomycetota bacterium]|nr:MAG: excinuclease ABC subunit UvrC [Planctomycetota bacterium]
MARIENASFDGQLRAAPARPGVYMFRDAAGKVLYVGKAKDLRRRVAVYRKSGADGRFKVAALLDRCASAEFRITDNEKEAILLEDRLVKRFQPPLNVQLKDDKAWLLVHLDTSHDFPRIGLARRRSGPGEYYGPYGTSGAARTTKRLLQRAFGLRDCSDHTFANRARPCLKYDIRLCDGPCVGLVEAGDYQRAVAGARAVLQGDVAALLAAERRRMQEASARLEYETAARARDRVRALEALSAPQKVRLEAGRDFDVLGVDERGQFALLQYRDGDWVDTRYGRTPLRSDLAADVAEIVSAVYRDEAAEIPPEVLVPELPEESDALESWLSERAQAPVRLASAARGEKRALLRLAESNARAQAGAEPGAPWPVVAARLSELTHYDPPAVVDCIDVSHLQGAERVASKVRFVEGRPARDQYRRYLVGGGVGNDDFAAMSEVLGRVLARADEEGVADLVVLDGGRLQLDAGLRAAEESGLRVPLIALAKARPGRGPAAAEERIFLPARAEPILLQRGNPERLFLERVRDEAHRFAITYHRNRRDPVRLILEEIAGVGPRKGKMLLEGFGGDLTRIRDADPAELAALPGLNLGLAHRIQNHLRRVL